MMKMVFGARIGTAALALAASVLAAGCALESADVPGVTGPSEYAISITATATPDRLPRDGSSQSVVTLNVRDAQNRPVAGQRLTLGLLSGAGTLSVPEVVTDANGQATFTVTAPPASALAGATVQIVATPVGNVSGGSFPRVIEISLTGSANTTGPSPSFTVTPASPEVGQIASFNASATTDEGVPCLESCTYTWAFGNEAVRTGRIQTHAFRTPGIHSVVLTVRDAAGISASVQQNVTVTSAAAPVVTLTVTPATPLAGQAVTLRAAVTTAPGHAVTKFDWTFGDGTSTTTTSPTVVKTYQAQAAYVATVTVTDDLGKTGSASLIIDVATSGTTTIVYSPKDPSPGQRVQFTAVTTTAGSTIKSYEWNFGDSEVEGGGTATGQSVEHTYNLGDLSHTYVVRLTVTDNNGVVTVITKDITVKVKDPP